MPKKKQPKQEQLIEDQEIKALTDAAHEYAEARDERQTILRTEVELKEKLLAQMKKLGKETYSYGDVEIKIVHEEETVRVKIRKPKEDKIPKE